MAEELREAVERLQSRLLENLDSRKLMKTLRRLGELPMTVDILVETGVGKTVNSLRKHDQAGDVAKTLVAKWKKLVPQATDRPSNTKEARTHGHSRSDIGSDGSRKRARDPSPEQAPHEGEEEEEEEEEERGYNTNYSPSPPRHHYSPPQLSHGGGQRGGYQSEGYESPTEEDPELEPSPPPRKETRHIKPHKETSRNHHAGGSHGDRDEERRHRHVQMGAGGSGGGAGRSEGRKRSAEREAQPSDVHKASKHSRHSTPHDSRKEKKGGSDGRPREHRDPLVAEEENEEQFDAPTMSFESFLTYDAPTPTKKKKKPPSSSRPPHASTLTPVPVSSSSSSSSKPSKANGSRSKRPEPSPSPMALTPVPEKRRKVVEVVAALPDITLPAIKPNYRPLPSIDLLTPLSPQRRKVPVSNDEEDAGFTGRRFNSKMVVYSGSKTAYLPKMMSLYDQCIRVLQNNIDSIDEVGGVPFEILEPVLERCTPEQLYRIEECNQCFMEDSDELWMRHCQRDFKRAAPQEYESWREMYLRLHDEREERLRMLTQNISSAHANKPKGRQVKMAFVNSVAKPPRDVRRRQEKFGTTSSSTASSTAAAAPIKIRPAALYSSHSTDPPSSSSSHYSPPQASRSSGSSGGGANTQKDKTQVKKIAPMMAKTIKAFKNRFSRR
ncbi:elongin-A [Osmerus mordax]|uniref:elongin-A n=1 Tax=Osmerus mordax TaxID=8014 RepID=UPI00350EA546